MNQAWPVTYDPRLLSTCWGLAGDLTEPEHDETSKKKHKKAHIRSGGCVRGDMWFVPLSRLSNRSDRQIIGNPYL